MKPTDRELGMDRPIQRRDFLNGVAVAIGAPLLGAHSAFAQQSPSSSSYYPPTLTGMRGTHPGSYDTAHSLRDHTFWKNHTDKPADTGERYDLVIVGGGISGLSAAYFYRKIAGDNARILILDILDDFGGHAKRNEFDINGRTLLGYGGTYAIESPSPYSPIAKSVIADLGIDVTADARVRDTKLYPSLGMGPGVFFDKATFGADVLLPDPKPEKDADFGDPGTSETHWKAFHEQAPLPAQAKLDIQRIYEGNKDYMPGLSPAEKKARLARMTYAKYLTDVVGADPAVVKYFQTRPHAYFGVGIDAVSAQDAWGFGLPGFRGLDLGTEPGPGISHDSIQSDEAEKYWFHFPDGNASIARLLVRKLLPAAIPGNSVEDVVTARADYARLDEASSSTRIRLNSTVARVQHVGDLDAAKEVEVAYIKDGKLQSVRGGRCILACWHTMIPYLTSEIPERQRKALSSAAKVPIVYTNVVLKNWTAFQKAGVNSVYAPGSYFEAMQLDLAVSMGGYKCPRTPGEPIVVHLMKTPCHPGLAARDQHLAGRRELYGTTFETFERNIRDQMGRALSSGGFDPARDIAAITVNRWPHGYAYEYNSLFDPFWLEGGEQPCVVARQPFGRVAIANADAAAYSYTDAAIDEAYRAVDDLLGISRG
ncbi:MAG TPA: FAD/NAD(P)-binding protein [Bryobacteraceae bacterium]|nr:FAD/NAD(P)-binding protein [Bryobacteraceae bacterium]